MMEPPLKRPRLSMFANMDPDPELDQARLQNDLLLKNRFEAIFEKYAHDFNGIGDVVDLNTGKVEEDNGHLRGIESEKDTGQSRSRSPKPNKKHSANGTSLLRAMTAAPDRNDSYFDDDNADDVIQSIETIAEIAVSDDDGIASAEDSGDDLFDTKPIRNIARGYMDEDTPYTSDADSLFKIVDGLKHEEHDDSRFSSPDSLFEGYTPPSAAQQNAAYEPVHHNWLEGHESQADGTEDEFDETAIYRKFGPKVGKEVVQLLEKRDMAELHIDPAWRIPVQARPRPVSSAGSHDTILEQAPTRKIAFPVESSPHKGRSVWVEGTGRKGSRFAPRAKATQALREESLDPLQEGFESDDDSEEDAELEQCNQVAKLGVCPYCQEQYVDRVGVMQHMNREAKFIQGGEDRGDHDPEHIVKLIDYIHEQAKRKYGGKLSGPRLDLCDYRTLVELHEGAGLTFQEIIDGEMLRTLKSDPELLAYLYFKWRDVEDVKGLDGKPSKEWSKTENMIVRKLLKTQTTGMDHFKRKLLKRSTVEIGNKLADKWLTELHNGKVVEVEDESEEEAALQPRPGTKDRKRKAPSPEFDQNVSEDEYRPERPQRKRKSKRPPSPLDDSEDRSRSLLEDLPSQSFDQTFAAATGMTPVPEQIPGLPPLPQSVIRGVNQFESYAWHGNEDLAGQPPEDDDLFVPTMWS